MKIDIIIPSKDEIDNLKVILPKLKKLFDYNILIIDKSSDEEFNEIQNLCKNYKDIISFRQKSSGKGNALREAAGISNAEYIVFFDADGSHNPEDIKSLILPFQLNTSVDHVGGSRMLGGSDELYSDFQHYIRLFGSLVINYCINLKFDVRVTDYQNGLRAIKRDVFLKLKTNSNHTSIEQEMVSRTLSQGFNYTEMPTHEWTRRSGVSKIQLSKHSWDYIWCLIKIMFYKKEKKKIIIKSYYKNWYE